LTNSNQEELREKQEHRIFILVHPPQGLRPVLYQTSKDFH